jgi:hypothetical protein
VKSFSSFKTLARTHAPLIIINEIINIFKKRGPIISPRGAKSACVEQHERAHCRITTEHARTPACLYLAYGEMNGPRERTLISLTSSFTRVM